MHFVKQIHIFVKDSFAAPVTERMSIPAAVIRKRTRTKDSCIVNEWYSQPSPSPSPLKGRGKRVLGRICARRGARRSGISRISGARSSRETFLYIVLIASEGLCIVL